MVFGSLLVISSIRFGKDVMLSSMIRPFEAKAASTLFPWIRTRPKLATFSLMTIVWAPSTAGTLNLNVDGSAIGNLGLAGRGGFIRRPDGSLITGFVNSFGVNNNLKAEILSLIVGLILCLAKGLRDVWEANSAANLLLKWAAAQRIINGNLTLLQCLKLYKDW
ncbi:hypothetical protein ACH5RR_025989 [Cinchona calisaya]|uniref:RNase H type-1 domain-containing protein n=1 Tax=Cinchona calisaya TaxID=153742 RepID=A0ABD2Z586_9GENT